MRREGGIHQIGWMKCNQRIVPVKSRAVRCEGLAPKLTLFPNVELLMFFGGAGGEGDAKVGGSQAIL